MDRLADEVLQIIFNEIDHPSSFVLACRRFNSFSKDPYVRAHYFLSRYGSVYALYWALGRGPLITEQVLDVLFSSGAHLSRYLVQIAVQHYFRSPCPFIKTPWVRTLTLSSFGHFLELSGKRFGAINTAKGEDDGTVFRNFIRDSRRPGRTDRRGSAADSILEMLEKGKFIPFCSKDPIIAQFPLALAIEPRLLPLAIANGFRMDSRVRIYPTSYCEISVKWSKLLVQYRDFVFRRIFARNQENGMQDILLNVRELCRLDTSMFVSRTVAAEVLMEAETNRTGYAALKALDREGDLRFYLASLVETLIQSFIRVHSITTVSTALSHLWKDYPSRSPIARLVMLLTVFISCSKATPDTLHSNLERLNLTPVSSEQITRVLLSPFVEHFSPILRYARVYCGINDDRMYSSFLTDVAVRCLEVSSKGNMLRSMCEDHPSLVDDIQIAVATKYRFTLGDLPSPEHEKDSPLFATKLCRDIHAFDIETAMGIHEFHEEGWNGSLSYDDDETETKQPEGVSTPITERFLDNVGQETLTQVISRDELDPRRKRSPWLSTRNSWPYKPPFPTDVQHVGRWILSHFGKRHLMTATFLNHAIANHNYTIMHLYLSDPLIVPITLQHFKILARLGHSTHHTFIQAIKHGAMFYFSDNDYLKQLDIEVKRETPCAETMPSGIVNDSSLSIEPPSSSSAMTSSSAAPTRKRLHRSAAATVKSYAYAQLDSDDETLTHENTSESFRHAHTTESNLQLWIKHLSVLHKEETKKFNEKKRRLKQSNLSNPKSRIVRMQSEFLKTLTSGLRELRQLEAKKQQAHVPTVPDEGSGSDDDEYQCPKRRRKMSS